MTGQYVFVCELFERTCSRQIQAKLFLSIMSSLSGTVHAGSVDRYGVTTNVHQKLI
jgi:hypothetical protein